MTAEDVLYDSGLLPGVVFALQRCYFGLSPADSVPSARAPHCRSRPKVQHTLLSTA